MDPRNDTGFSLKNLLRVRSARNDYTLAVLGTPEGMLMAGSRIDPLAEHTAAQASFELFRGKKTPYGRFTRVTPEGRLSGIRFEVDGRPLLLALLDGEELEPEQRDEFVLDQLAERVQRILAAA